MDVQSEKEVTLIPGVQVIAFTGRAGSGKNAAAQHIAECVVERGEVLPFPETYVVGIEAFAGPPKSMIGILLDFFNLADINKRDSLLPYLEGELKEIVIPEIGMSPRQLLQTLGTEWGRDVVNPDIWVNSMRARLNVYEEVRKHGYAGVIVVLTDLRFDNEAELVRSVGGKIIEIVRDAAPETVGEAGHVSEGGISPTCIDATIFNNDTIGRFHMDIASTLARFGIEISALSYKEIEEIMLRLGAFGEEPNDVETAVEATGS